MYLPDKGNSFHNRNALNSTEVKPLYVSFAADNLRNKTVSNNERFVLESQVRLPNLEFYII